jgi:hypothetical protein
VPTYIYIDYGPSPDIALELKYSFATLLAECAGHEPDAVVYTDKPEVYAGLHPRLRARPLGSDFARWSREGLYAHRLKPCVLLDALLTLGGACALVDTDTFFRAGFAHALDRAVAEGRVAMDHFERIDPCPDCAGVATALPHAGRYIYDPTQARMFNSGLVATTARDAPAIEDAIALIDAWLDAGLRQLNLEQIAVSEAFRLHEREIAEMKPVFAHYYLRSQKLYMRPRIAAWLGAGGLRATRPFLTPSKARVRLARILDRLAGRA